MAIKLYGFLLKEYLLKESDPGTISAYKEYYVEIAIITFSLQSYFPPKYICTTYFELVYMATLLW